MQGYGDVRQSSNNFTPQDNMPQRFDDTPMKNGQQGFISNQGQNNPSASFVGDNGSSRKWSNQIELWGNVQTQEDPFRSPVPNGAPAQRRKSEESGAGMSEKQKWNSAAKSAEKLGSG